MIETSHRSARSSAAWLLLAGALFLTPAGLLARDASMKASEKPEKVSYYEDIRPIFQAKCHGCHQPAKAKGDYVMTSHDALISGGEEGEAIIPGNAKASYLFEQIVPVDGSADMPKKDDPLKQGELALVQRWIAEGAIDDTPANARQRYDMDHLPTYEKAPVITAIDYSPDGKLIAVAGFHEVLLHQPDGSGVVARLVGLSERIESVRFSPDGKKLAVTGGLPARMGEVQIWDVEKRELDLSVPITFDTVYGASWSPDGKFVAFGCADKTVRAIDASTGKQVLFMGSHNDWALDTAFSNDGSHLVSVGRDMSAKLTKVETERFVDNITSITPKALKGGIATVARHPERDEILVGGSDGMPQSYRLFRQTARKIGDNANLLRRFPPMEGRVWSVAYRADGKQIAAGSSYNGRGAVNIYTSDYDMELPKPVADIYSKPSRFKRSTAEQKTLDDFHTAGAALHQSIQLDTPVFAVAFSPDGKTVAVGGDDGRIRLIDAASGKIRTEFVPVTLADAGEKRAGPARGSKKPVELARGKAAPDEDESLPAGTKIKALRILPESIEINTATEYNQLIVLADLASGETADVTRIVDWSLDKPVIEIGSRGRAEPARQGRATLTASVGPHAASAAVTVKGLAQAIEPNFTRDVNPVITRLGCNAGACHGAKDGKNGFKLSLRGYDPVYDVRAFADDHIARRVNRASVDDSLMLLKATGAVPHEGQQVTQLNSKYYRIIRDWIEAGTPLDTAVPRVKSIEIFPKNPVVTAIGSRQQMRVVATFDDGETRDVTSEAFIDSGNLEVALTDDFGLLSSIRRGEAPVLARYEGAYAATTMTVMGDRSGFEWKDAPANNEIDKLVAAKWQRLKIRPSGLCTDEEFVRRIYLDLTGLPPSAGELRKFLADKTPSRKKRDALVDRLIGSPDFVDHWTNNWADKLMVNSKFLGPEGATAFRAWIRENVEKNTPYDDFVKKILTASGSNKDNPAASYFKILRTPEDLMENTTHLFLATRFNCNKCHDHPFERWTQNQYFETAAYFSQVSLKPDAKGSGNRKIAGTAVEEAKSLYEEAIDMPEGEMVHERTGAVTPPAFPYTATAKTKPDATRREQLADWITAPDNQYFAMSYANRIWGYLVGTGIIEPLDDIRAGNPPSNPELLNWLTAEFINSDFDARHLMQLVCKSRTYQLSIATNEWNADDTVNFSHAKARRLPAEVLFDAVYAATGSTPNIPGAKPGTRAAQLTDAKIDLKSGFLANLGRPPRESSCECERSNDVQLGAVMALLSGPAVADAVGDPKNAIAKLVRTQTDDRAVIEEIFFRVLNRKPNDTEIAAALENGKLIESDHKKLVAALAVREAEMVPVMAERERKRAIAINKATADIDGYRPEFQKKQNEAEAARKTRLAAAEKAVKEVEALLPKKVSDWEANLGVKDLWTRWQPLEVAAVTASDKSKVEILPDGSVRATGGIRKLDYLLTGKTNLKNITGIMIESVPDGSFVGSGAGLNPNGNFVITEVQARWNTAADAKKELPIAFADAAADHNQKGFSIKNVFNGKLDRSDKGWAISGSNLKIPHRAALKLKAPMAGDPKGATLTVGVLCRYSNNDYPIGRFRVWVTTDSDPLSLGLPADVATAVSVAPGARSKAQVATVLDWVTHNDPDLREKQSVVAKEKRPLPADPKMVAFEAALAKAERPVLQDPRLIQLRQDVKMSIEQSANRRLTAAQDLTWALINSPAFLFNH